MTCWEVIVWDSTSGDLIEKWYTKSISVANEQIREVARDYEKEGYECDIGDLEAWCYKAVEPWGDGEGAEHRIAIYAEEVDCEHAKQMAPLYGGWLD